MTLTTYIITLSSRVILIVQLKTCIHTMQITKPCNAIVQVFVADKVRPGWSVVVKKEAMKRQISSMGVEHCLGQEDSSGDWDVFTVMEEERRESSNKNNFVVGRQVTRRGRWMRWQ